VARLNVSWPERIAHLVRLFKGNVGRRELETYDFVSGGLDAAGNLSNTLR
jgi:hypothetical protein